jgi:hypothetical protein
MAQGRGAKPSIGDMLNVLSVEKLRLQLMINFKII